MAYTYILIQVNDQQIFIHLCYIEAILASQ